MAKNICRMNRLNRLVFLSLEVNLLYHGILSWLYQNLVKCGDHVIPTQARIGALSAFQQLHLLCVTCKVRLRSSLLFSILQKE